LFSDYSIFTETSVRIIKILHFLSIYEINSGFTAQKYGRITFLPYTISNCFFI